MNEPGRWRRPDLVAAIKEQDTDWKSFLCNRPDDKWDARKYLEYRWFWPYSSGIPGQWMCHQIDTIYWFTGLPHPRSVAANGGIYQWKDGRTNFDTLTAVFDYSPLDNPTSGFHVTYGSRFSNSSGETKEVYYSNGGELNLATGKVTSNGGLKEIEAAAMKMKPNLLACNGFIRPANLHCVGPEANHEPILKWAETTFRRMKKAGGKIIVFGSSGARKIPNGWTKEQADEQFVSLLKRMGPLAEAHGIIVTIEQLRAEECNYINRIGEGAALIRAAGHPNIRLLADIYHMAVMGAPPADLTAAMDVVTHVEIAEKTGRTIPGVGGDDFRPFFRVLRESGYQGAVSIEGKWSDAQLAPAFAEIAKQAGDV